MTFCLLYAAANRFIWYQKNMISRKSRIKTTLDYLQKNGENAQYYRRVLIRKKHRLWGFESGLLSICDTFWVQNHI